MKVETKFNLGDRVVAQIFPGKFEWCTIRAITIADDPAYNPAYQMENGLLVRGVHCFLTREEAIEWAEKNPHEGK